MCVHNMSANRKSSGASPQRMNFNIKNLKGYIDCLQGIRIGHHIKAEGLSKENLSLENYLFQLCTIWKCHRHWKKKSTCETAN